MKMKKILAMVLAAMLLVAVSVMGTMAYLVDTTEEVENTFTSTDIAITLTEDDTPWTMPLIPGTSKDKNPIVTVVRGETNVDIYLFVKYVENATGTTDGKTYLEYTNTLETATYTTDEGTVKAWTKFNDEGVYYMIVPANAGPMELGSCPNANCEGHTGELHWHLIAGDSVTVNSNLTADDTDNAAISITYEAWAIQKDGFDTVNDAWNAVKDLTPANDGSTAGKTN